MAGKDVKGRKSFLSLRSEVMELGSSASGFECDGYLSEGVGLWEVGMTVW